MLINRFVKEFSCLVLTINRIIRQVLPTPELPMVRIFSTESLGKGDYLLGAGFIRSSCSAMFTRAGIGDIGGGRLFAGDLAH